LSLSKILPEDSANVSWLWKKCLRVIVVVVLWIGRHFLKWNRLEKIDLVDLEAPIEDAVSLYGDPIKSEPDERVAGAIVHTFSAPPFHEVVVVEFNRRVHLITYWSVYPDPNRDLKCMLTEYGKGIGWNELEPGYLCVRKDEKVWLRCSVAPALCVETVEYLNAKRAATELG
jgi:hypothetical protein